MIWFRFVGRDLYTNRGGDKFDASPPHRTLDSTSNSIRYSSIVVFVFRSLTRYVRIVFSESIIAKPYSIQRTHEKQLSFVRLTRNHKDLHISKTYSKPLISYIILFIIIALMREQPVAHAVRVAVANTKNHAGTGGTLYIPRRNVRSFHLDNNMIYRSKYLI